MHGLVQRRLQMKNIKTPVTPINAKPPIISGVAQSLKLLTMSCSSLYSSANDTAQSRANIRAAKKD